MNKAQIVVSGFVAVVAVACGGNKKEPAAPQSPAPTQVTKAEVKPQPGLAISEDITKACQLKIGPVEEAPKFDFDSADLTPQEREVLAEVAKCLTTGPLAGRAVQLVGRADPRGEMEYNMALGARRAKTVHGYLSSLGVGQEKMKLTSRGELDATGKDEAGWKLDRRVDVKLAN